jgi:hypothetical protein
MKSLISLITESERDIEFIEYVQQKVMLSKKID